MLDCLLLSKVGLHGLTYDIAIEREKEKQDIMILGATVTIQAPTTWGQEEEEELDLLELAPGARLFWRSRCDGGAR